jgi:hypothetical protein
LLLKLKEDQKLLQLHNIQIVIRTICFNALIISLAFRTHAAGSVRIISHVQGQHNTAMTDGRGGMSTLRIVHRCQPILSLPCGPPSVSFKILLGDVASRTSFKEARM